MKRVFLLILVLLLLIPVSFFSLEGRELSIWNKAIRKFSGLRNLEAKIDIEMYLLNGNKEFINSEYGMKLWIRDLRDYRVDFYVPNFISDISMLYRYSESLLYVINKEMKEYSIQYFGSLSDKPEYKNFTSSATDSLDISNVNPADTLIKTLDFLIGLDSNPFVDMSAKSDDGINYEYIIKINQPAGFSLLFVKEYPMITIEINDKYEIVELAMINDGTGEFLSICINDLNMNSSQEEIDEAFEDVYEGYDLIDYVGKTG